MRVRLDAEAVAREIPVRELKSPTAYWKFTVTVNTEIPVRELK